MARLAKRAGALPWLLLLLGSWSVAAPAAESRVLLPGSEETPAAEPLRAALLKGGFTISGGRQIRLEPAALAGIDVIVLGADAAPLLDGSGDDGHRALLDAVRAGAGLVVLAEALAGRKPPAELLRLLGATREDPGPARGPARGEAGGETTGVAGGKTGGESGGVLVTVPDQSHAILQCVTHLYLERSRVAFTGGAGTRVLAEVARSAREAAPVIWTRSEGRGLVAVIGIAVGPESQRERALLAALAARAAQWARRLPITVPLPDDLPLAVRRREPPALEAEDAHGYFRGRQIAPVMGFEGADWLVRKDREETEQPEALLDALAIAPGATVADLGAGNGYFSLRLARRVGEKGKVLAVDLQPQMIALLKEEIQRRSVANVEPILAAEDDPRLPASSVDLALLVDVYHELSKPLAVMQKLRASLREGTAASKPGRLVLVEYRGEDPTVPIKPPHRTTVAQVRAEIEPMGFRFVELKGFLPHQHILIFERQ